MMNNESSHWIPVGERLPEAIYGEEGQPPIISDDVVIFFESGDLEIANYDHEDNKWSLPNRGFSEPDCDPTYWLPLPPTPERQPTGAGRGNSSRAPA